MSAGLKEENVLELLDIYMDLVEKQDEVIYRLSKVVAKQATDLKHLKNIYEFVDMDLDSEAALADEALQQYRDMLPEE